MQDSSQGFVPIHQIVLELIAQLRQTTLHKYAWLLNYTLIAYRRLLYNTIPISKVCTVKVTATKTIPLPEDWVGLLNVGVQNGDRITPIHEDTTINRVSTKDNPYYPAKEIQDRRYSYQYFNKSTDYNKDDSYAGIGIDQLGTYKLNLGKRCLELSVNTRINIGDTMVIDYISSGFNPDTETLVYVAAAEMIKANAMWQWYQFKEGGQSRQTESWRITFLREQAEFRANISNLSKDSILSAMARVASVQPKY